MIPYIFYDELMYSPLFTPTDDRPPTLYFLLDSMVNYHKPEEDRVRIKDLPVATKNRVFDFDYPIKEQVRDEFEELFLKKFLMRRIGYETYTAWKIALDVKLNTIMPKYNKMFEAVDNWDLFKDGETETREYEDIKDTKNNSTNELKSSDVNSNTSNMTTSNSSTTDSNNITDNRNSDTPQNRIDDVKNGSYLTNYEYKSDTVNSTDNSNSTASNNTIGESNKTENNTAENIGKENIKHTEKIERTGASKLDLMIKYQTEMNSIYEMLWIELDDLFYQLI